MTLVQKTLLLSVLVASLHGLSHAETVEDIVTLAHKGATEQELLAAVKRSDEGFHLTYANIKACQDAGVPESVLSAMAQEYRVAKNVHHGVLDTAVFEHWGMRITLWKLIAYFGTFIFAGRWLVQMLASRKAGRPVTTVWFWVMSFIGSAFCLAYWILGPKQDSVGVLQNLFPTFVAAYNLYLEIRYYKKHGVASHAHGEAKAARNAKREAAEPADAIEVAAGQ